MPENYVLIERTELNAAVSSVTFSNIPQTGYTDLKIVCSTRTDYAGFLDLNMFLNGNASSGYSWRRLNGDGGSATSTSSTSAGVIPSATLGTTSTANTFANTEIYIPNYTSTTSKSVSIDAVTENNATTSYQTFTAGLSTLSTAITSVSFGLGAGNFVANSTFSLYGIAALGTTPAIAPKASGGNRIDNDGTYWYHTFTSSGSFVPQIGINCDVLVVAGGGSGGSWASGGGGAGQIRYATSQFLTTTTQAITVGAGGTSVPDFGGGGGVGGDGSNSSLTSTIIAIGGGGGGGSAGNLPFGIGRDGGSGGGGAYSRAGGSALGTGTGGTAYGFAGGSAVGAGNFGSAGGGGAGAVGGSTGGSANGQPGGIGLATWSSWGSVTNTGQNVSGTFYYAGGGGGGGQTGAAGGSGGGGAGSSLSAGNGIAGTTNTGGGGGGQRDTGSGGNGGSGIVIIRYPIA
jgi:hypothetical protein